MDARAQRRLRREAVRNVGYTKFLKKHTHKKNIAAREKRMLRRRVLRDECMKKEVEKKARKDVKMTFKEESRKEKEVMISIPISDIRKILQAKEYTHKATMRGMALGEINYQLWKIQKICEKYIK